ncbi:MAG TPA: radical SAM protein [Rickettsiales bacterium]|nr:radical SAM protein [Rickettsiales bacterium]
MLSKFMHKIKIDKNNYAILNSLLFEPILMNKNEVEKLLKGDLSLFTEKDVQVLFEKGILIDNILKDEEIKETLIETVNNKFKKDIGLIYMIPVEGCNLACKYCFIGKINNKKDQAMTKEIADITIKKFTDYLIKNENREGTVLFYGGEPTLNFNIIKQTIDSIKKYAKNNIDVAMVTNGTLFTDEMLEFFKQSRISVGISIDGPKELNDKYRIFKQSNESVYDLVTKNINKIKKSGVEFGLSVTLSNESLENKEFLNWLNDLDVKSINYNLMHYTEKTDEWKKYYKKVSKFLFKSYDFLNRNNIKDGRILRKFRAFYGNKFKYNDCGAVGGEQLTIKPNGDITVCHGYWNSTKEICGNIKENSFEDIIKTDIYQKWRNNLTVNKEKCLKCPAIYICGGGCPKQSEALFGDQKEIDKSFCIYTKFALKELLKRFFEAEYKK